MATLKSTILSEIRLQVGDNNADNYFISDAQWNSFIDNSVRKLKKYIRKKSEVTITGTGVSSYNIPDEIVNERWSAVLLRDNDDPDTDRPLKGYRNHGAKLYTKFDITSAQKIVFLAKTGYTLGTDTFPDDALDILYLLLKLEFINYSAFRRSDFEQWASLNRSDSSINQLLLLARELRDQLASAEKENSDGVEVSELSHYD